MSIWASVALSLIPAIAIFLSILFFIKEFKYFFAIFCCFAGALAFTCNKILLLAASALFPETINTLIFFLECLIAAGILQEGLKTLFLFIFPVKNIKLLDYMAYSALCGLSAGSVEMFLYIRLLNVFKWSFLAFYIIQSMCAMLDGLTVYSYNKKKKQILPFIFAVLFHGMYNYFTSFADFRSYFAIFVALLAVIEVKLRYSYLNIKIVNDKNENIPKEGDVNKMGVFDKLKGIFLKKKEEPKEPQTTERQSSIPEQTVFGTENKAEARMTSVSQQGEQQINSFREEKPLEENTSNESVLNETLSSQKISEEDTPKEMASTEENNSLETSLSEGLSEKSSESSSESIRSSYDANQNTEDTDKVSLDDSIDYAKNLPKIDDLFKDDINTAEDAAPTEEVVPKQEEQEEIKENDSKIEVVDMEEPIETIPDEQSVATDSALIEPEIKTTKAKTSSTKKATASKSKTASASAKALASEKEEKPAKRATTSKAKAATREEAEPKKTTKSTTTKAKEKEAKETTAKKATASKSKTASAKALASEKEEKPAKKATTTKTSTSKATTSKAKTAAKEEAEPKKTTKSTTTKAKEKEAKETTTKKATASKSKTATAKAGASTKEEKPAKETKKSSEKTTSATKTATKATTKKATSSSKSSSK